LTLKQIIVNLIAEAIAKVKESEKIPSLTDTVIPEIVLERPQNPDHGDYACSIALKLARAAKTSPLNVASEIVSHIASVPEISTVTIAKPGFINFTLSSAWLAQQVTSILEAGNTYGNIGLGKGKRVQIEFVSVNPTGPLHVGHGRGAVLGSALYNILTAAGYHVEKEYYINDAGHQVDVFRRSLYARYQQCIGIDAKVPEDGYVGEYLTDMAKEIIAEHGDALKKLPEPEVVLKLGRIGLEKMLGYIRADLEMLAITFDVWFSEKSLFDNKQYDTAMSLLKKQGYISEKEGATWFTSTALGEDKDNVVVRTDGTPTYFATDIAYHYNKFIERKFDRVIDIWGADHMGHVSRMKAVVGALGVDPERLTILISQLVTLRRGGEIVRLSKRSGDIITLKELVEEVGADACRFFFLSRTADSQMDFDLELAKKQSADNPVYYVQYAHARIASILRTAEEKGCSDAGGDVSLLTTAPELTLIRRMLMLTEIVETIAETLEPHHLTYYAQDLANVFHAFYKDCRVISDDAAITAARLKLVKAAKDVLGRTLGLMGMTAPDSM
jgi:arginyl-tRNA synthetase